MGFLQALKAMLGMVSAPRINVDSVFEVFIEDRKIARLEKPHVADQFWIEFQLTPTTEDPDDLRELYTAEFWNGERVRIVKDKTKRAFRFILSAEHDYSSGEPPTRPLSKRPEQISLRLLDP